MEKISDLKNVLFKDNLLARLMSLFYVIPAITSKAPLRQRNIITRSNLPAYRVQKTSDRARDFIEREASGDCFASSESAVTEAVSDFGADSDQVVLDAESDPAHAAKLGTGPGDCSLHMKACRYSGRSCCCDCCKRRRRLFVECDFLQNCRSSISTMPHAKSSRPNLRVIGSKSEPFVLGVLRSGYVLSGSGKLKELAKKRA